MGKNMSKVTIYCPRCGRAVLHVEDRCKTDLSVKCKKCNKLITYQAEYGKTIITSVPKRSSSAGCRFY